MDVSELSSEIGLGDWNERDANTILLSLQLFTQASTHYIIITELCATLIKT